MEKGKSVREAAFDQAEGDPWLVTLSGKAVVRVKALTQAEAKDRAKQALEPLQVVIGTLVRSTDWSVEEVVED